MEKNIIEEEGFVKGYIEPVSIRQTETRYFKTNEKIGLQNIWSKYRQWILL